MKRNKCLTGKQQQHILFITYNYLVNMVYKTWPPSFPIWVYGRQKKSKLSQCISIWN